MADTAEVVSDFFAKYQLGQELSAIQIQEIYGDIRVGSLSLSQVLFYESKALNIIFKLLFTV